MIEITRYDGSKQIINCDLIEFIEAAPDTVITVRGGNKIRVKEKVSEIVDRVIEFKRRIHYLSINSNEDSQD